MKSIARFLALVVLALSTFAQPAHARFTYTFYPDDDTINSEISTDLTIIGYAGGSYDASFHPNFTGPSSPTVQIANGANIIGEVDSFNSSVVNVTGGNIGTLATSDNSILNVTGGNVGGLFSLNDSIANVSDGFVGYALNIDNAVISMTGGTISNLDGQGKAIHVSGGQVDTLVANTNTDLFGNTLGSCIVDVTGGSFGELNAFNDGILNLRGGLPGSSLYAAFGGTINIFGIGLKAALVDPAYNNRYSLYSLSGILADGTALTGNNLYIENEGVTYGYSSFNLVAVPEPGSLALLGIVLPIIGVMRCRVSKRLRA